MHKNLYFRLLAISVVFLLSILVVLPRIPITFKKSFVNIDSYIGGYSFSLFGGRWRADLTKFREGLDLAGGVRVVLNADVTKIGESERNSALESAVSVIEKRVNYLGVAEPYIAPAKVGDEYRIIVEIPGVSDTASAVKLIGQTAQLKFKVLVVGKDWTEEKFSEYYSNPTAWVDSGVTGADLKGVDVLYDQSKAGTNSPQVRLKFTNEGRKKFSQVARENVKKPVALFLDEDSTPLSMPVVSENLADALVNDPVITGNFSIETANALSIQLRAGALPVPVEVIEQKTVGATLGDISVHRSLYGGIVGLTLVLVFMVYSYGRLGFLADIALLIYAVITLAIFKGLPVVLTLPGIAGFILSVGMATDANILVFERIKEELAWGRPKTLAAKFGFERAWSSIRDSNISSLITAAVLFYFGTGAVRGFALTLSIGILVSLFTSLFVTQTFVKLFGGLSKD
ncbi:MAG: Preprotein translocase subunit SecD [candidate division WWE3 bacterium GW2011_GWB1_47_11]|uniref:Protein translocase subunit SecD n=1 Tax=candidate division WWE3 bacterium GW2011_GWB1_47_11 TaxID=1619117 RepID=A0A0G1RM07_UNCKA|nr:MAG: Preprotein translocase subunit SecD [candidate division WWE3 bacterium GW2011_GWB1_47_11]